MLKQKAKAIYFTRFEYASNAGGGCRRFVQILNDLRQMYDVKVVSTRDNEDYNRARCEVIHIKPEIEWDDSFCAVNRYLLMGAYWFKHVDLTPYSVVFVDDPVYFSDVVYKSRELGISIVGFCHNLETLADGQIKDGQVIPALMTELKILEMLDLTVTISYEETVLLNNIGADTYYYPYYPVELIEMRMKKVCQARKSIYNNTGSIVNNDLLRKRKEVLFLGSLGNIPTKIGLERLLDAWKYLYIYDETSYQLHVTGFGSEMFQHYESEEYGIKVLGPLSETDLDSKLSEVESVIVYQRKGSGALTKINELLIAGVPIMANGHAIRSYLNMSGIHLFEDDLHNLLSVMKDIEKLSCDPNHITPLPKPNPLKLLTAIKSCVELRTTDTNHSRYRR